MQKVHNSAEKGTEKPPTERCRGAACRSRRNAADPNRLTIKRHAAPICHCEEAQPTWRSRRTWPNREKAIGENATASPRLHPKGTSSRFALRAPRQGSASCISALPYNILSKKSKIAINPDFSGPISPFRLLSQKKSVMMEGRICNCIFHGRFCRCPALFPVHNAAASG